MNLYFQLAFIENHSVICIEMDDDKSFCDLIKEVKLEYGYSKLDTAFGSQQVVRWVLWKFCAVFGNKGKLETKSNLIATTPCPSSFFPCTVECVPLIQ